jgi:hypothetical protein
MELLVCLDRLEKFDEHSEADSERVQLTERCR